ncbi:MAG: hypothetical protein AB3N16_07380 [Flavobacteriaceae bacterium]
MNRYLVLITASVFGFLCSCSSDDPLNPLNGCGSASWSKRVESEINAFNQALMDYSEDPSKANCENYREKGNAYLKALEDVSGCVVGANRASYQNAIDEAKKELSEIDCTEG